MKVLVLGSLDGTEVGEQFSGYKMVEALSKHADVTLLSLQRKGRRPVQDQLPNARVITWDEPEWLSRFERFYAMAKPAWPLLTRHAERWLRTALAGGERFDVAHQLLPQAMRHRCPFRKFDIPYVIGPLGGSLETPADFVSEVVESTLIGRLRRMDKTLLKYDSGLRASYREASLILGVAPYVQQHLSSINLQRFDVFLERAGDVDEQRKPKARTSGELKLLFVGRVIRTKGLRDAIRSLPSVLRASRVRLTVAGDGPDLENCKREARELGIQESVEFLGRVPREVVNELYDSHDVFLFPSFREPMGGVLFEALEKGIPIITTTLGGPGYIVDESCGINLEAKTREQFPRAIADAVLHLDSNRELLMQLSAGALARARVFGSWDEKAAGLVSLYEELVQHRPDNTMAS